MSLFDQQPMGPVPASRPIRVPADPALESIADDPSQVKVEVVAPLPPELAQASEHAPERSTLRIMRAVVASILVFGFGLALTIAAYRSVVPGEGDEGVPLPALAVLVLVIGGGAVATLWSRLRRSTP